MADWILVPCLVALRAAFNALAPERDHSSDGSIGDDVHEAEVSDHNPDETGAVPIHDTDHVNEVHAIDVDDDLRTPGLDMETVVQFLLARCRAGREKRLRYIIYNRRIWSASNDWKLRVYTGASPHTEHAHFSASYESAREADTSTWHLEEITVALSEADKKWIVSLLNGPAGDVMPRWSAEGGPVPKDDPNPTQTPAAASYYTGAGVRRVENLCASILAAVGLVDDQVLAGLADSGRNLPDLATIIRGALGTEQAEELGKLLIPSA